MKNILSFKYSFKKHWPRILSAFFFVLLLISYARIFAIGSPYLPGVTLDPACVPGEVNCKVDFGVSLSGLILTPLATGFSISGGTASKTLTVVDDATVSGINTGDESYTNATPTPNTVGGISAGSTFSAQTMKQVLDRLLYPYIAPSISLSLNPSTGIREFGDTVASVIMNATTTKHSNNITLVEFYRDGSLIHTQASPIAGGGLESYTDGTGVSTIGVTFTAKVGDGTQTVTSGTSSYTFVYPFYYGVGAQGLTGAQIRSTLTHLIKTQSNTVTTTSPSSQVFYLAYPDTSPILTSILDTNGFETISDYTLRTVSITGLDSTPQTYKVYEYNNPTTQINFTNTFKF